MARSSRRAQSAAKRGTVWRHAGEGDGLGRSGRGGETPAGGGAGCATGSEADAGAVASVQDVTASASSAAQSMRGNLWTRVILIQTPQSGIRFARSAGVGGLGVRARQRVCCAGGLRPGL